MFQKINKILYVVHCVDTEGPLNETIEATFRRLQSIFGIKLDPTYENLVLLQNKKINLGGQEDAVSKCFSPDLLKYNRNWFDIEQMLEDILSEKFRSRLIDDFGNGWIYSWHCMDHVGYTENPRHKDFGYGNIFRFYRDKLKDKMCTMDEINWHFHPLSITRNPIAAATSYVNSYDQLIQILCRRILDEDWFPVVNRPGFHSERPDSHTFLEQWIPFDYANQFSGEESHDQPDFMRGRFGAWDRAPSSWRGYNPHHDDYQAEGSCRRRIFRCLNVGTRTRVFTMSHVESAFREADATGGAILAFADHDFRDMRPDVHQVQNMLTALRKNFPDVKIKFSGAEAAARSLLGWNDIKPPKLSINLIGNTLDVELQEGEIFGPQPFLAIKSKEGNYYHDNFDLLVPKKKWSYVFDEQTIYLSNVSKISAATAGLNGNRCIATLYTNK